MIIFIIFILQATHFFQHTIMEAQYDCFSRIQNLYSINSMIIFIIFILQATHFFQHTIMEAQYDCFSRIQNLYSINSMIIFIIFILQATHFFQHTIMEAQYDCFSRIQNLYSKVKKGTVDPVYLYEFDRSVNFLYHNFFLVPKEVSI